MPASRALFTGCLNADLSTTAIAMPSALEEMAVLVAFTISATMESLDPVHWNWQLSSAQASCAPYWVGVKNGLVVTWLTNTNFQFGVDGKSPAAPEDWLPDSLLLLEQAASSADAASPALVSPTPESSRRRVTGLRLSVSTASSTRGSIWDMRPPTTSGLGSPSVGRLPGCKGSAAPPSLRRGGGGPMNVLLR